MASVNKRPDGRWRARYRDPAGREHARHFVKRIEAVRWLDEIAASVVTGNYVDPNAGRIHFQAYAEQWRTAQMHRPSSQAHVETMLRRHTYPTFGERSLSSILPSEIQAWVKKLGQDDPKAGRKALAPATIGVIHGIVSGVFKAAMRDRMIMSSPCDDTRLPKVERMKVVPPSTEQVKALREAMPERLRALITLAAGTGMRQGEMLGLTVDRIDFLRREIHVDRQLVTDNWDRSRFGPPKTPASNRTIPLPQVVVDALAAHVAACPLSPDGLVFTLDGRPITRQAFGRAWRPAASEVGLPSSKGVHLLRHYYASLLIRYGENVKTVQARLGHASAAETLDTYSHLWPDSDDRTRDAVDEVLGKSSPPKHESLLDRSTRHNQMSQPPVQHGFGPPMR